MKDCEIQVTDALVLLDREQGGTENLSVENIKIHSVLKTSDVLNILLNSKRIDQQIFDKTVNFLNANKHVAIAQAQIQEKAKEELNFEERANLCKNKMSKKLFEIMSMKKTNLCVAADYNSFDQLLQVKIHFYIQIITFL